MTQGLLGRVHRELLDVLNSINQDKIHHDGDDFHELLNDVEKALAQPEQEPVGVVNIGDGGNWYFLPLVPTSELPEGTKFYTTPPQRTWVGLTGIDQKELMAMSARDAVFATEAKLKEKNT